MIDKVFDLALLVGHYYLTKEEREERRKQKEREERQLVKMERSERPTVGTSVRLENCNNCSVTVTVHNNYY